MELEIPQWANCPFPTHFSHRQDVEIPSREAPAKSTEPLRAKSGYLSRLATCGWTVATSTNLSLFPSSNHNYPLHEPENSSQ